jgi:hypothetical protein
MIPKFESLCDPAKLYISLVLISVVFSLYNGLQVMSAIVQVLFALFWTFVLNWICQKGYKGVSWFLVLLPFILMVLVYLGIMTNAKMK